MPSPADPPHEPATPSRRTVLRAAGTLSAVGAVAAVGSTALTVEGAEPAFAAAPPSVDVLVVINLRGGFDGLCAIAPLGDPDYAVARPTIKVPASAARQVDDMFGLHPALAPLFGLWDAGKLAAVHAVGQTSPSRSHAEATAALERAVPGAPRAHGAPGAPAAGGWIERAMARVSAAAPFSAVQLGSAAPAGSLAGSPSALAVAALADVRVATSENVVSLPSWAGALTALTKSGGPAAGITAATRAGLSTAGLLRTLPAAGSAGDAGYPPGTLGTALHDVARLVNASIPVRIATLDHEGWDMHADLGSPTSGRMADQLSELATALVAFAAELGKNLDRVSVVTLTEFGRRVRENGSGGVDHGHGTACLLLGGAVNGKRVYGRWPGLKASELDDGDLAGTTDYRQILAELLTRRCGFSSVSTIFPGLVPAPLGLVRAR